MNPRLPTPTREAKMDSIPDDVMAIIASHTISWSKCPCRCAMFFSTCKRFHLLQYTSEVRAKLIEVYGVTCVECVKYSVSVNKCTVGHPLGWGYIDRCLNELIDALEQSRMMRKLLFTENNYVSTFIRVCVGGMRGTCSIADVIHERARKFRMTSFLAHKYVTNRNVVKMKHIYPERISQWDTILTSIAAYVWESLKLHTNLNHLWLLISLAFMALMRTFNLLYMKTKTQRMCVAGSVITLAGLCSGEIKTVNELMSFVSWYCDKKMMPQFYFQLLLHLRDLSSVLHLQLTRPGSPIFRFARMHDIKIDTRTVMNIVLGC